MLKIIIKKDFCKSCGFCVNVCPKGILVMDDKLNTLGYSPVKVVGESSCIKCMRCIAVCPEACIEIYEEDGK
ncbi:MAG: 4Fe-4S dicluster domain-containing protein [Candidatus Kaelpia imicola]|nr:4Fe-4S dicluster domain-containing protein [Candidatus Kaelpia imicola]